MFWALKGATARPRREKMRQRAAVSKLLPALEETPCTIRAGTPGERGSFKGRRMDVKYMQILSKASRKSRQGLLQAKKWSLKKSSVRFIVAVSTDKNWALVL
jgi:hypothetical protein